MPVDDRKPEYLAVGKRTIRGQDEIMIVIEPVPEDYFGRDVPDPRARFLELEIANGRLYLQDID
jgi:hypothetical protein